MPDIKICGLSTAPTLEAALEAGADLVGFVFFPRSPRHVDFDTAAGLGRLVRRRAGKVALTVDAADDLLDRIVAALRPDMLQLHGRETPRRLEAIKDRYGLPIIKAVGIGEAADIAALDAYRGVADRFLLDAKPPRDASRPGGNGMAFDWSLMDGLDRSTPIMLSGGLDAANVAEAIGLVRPDGVDTSSGVEDGPGMKNVDKIRSFVAASRAAFAKGPVEESVR
jgi:phosphoribosylanthranilate isomerase